MPTDFLGRVLVVFNRYGMSMLHGAGVSMGIALVGTVIGCAIGFAVGIVQTIPSEKGDNPIKRGVLGGEAGAQHLCGVFPRHAHDGTGHVHLLWTVSAVECQHVHVGGSIFHSVHQHGRLHG